VLRHYDVMQDPRLDRGKQLGGIHWVFGWRYLPMVQGIL
jgi:hypothetical protein